MEKTIYKNNKGFSLMELLITLAISAFVILAAFSFVMAGVNSYHTTNKTTTVQQEMSFTTNMIGERIRSADITKISISKWTDGDIEVHTGQKVFYYDKDTTSLYVYTEDPTKGVGDTSYKVNNSDNLVSSYITSFDVDYVNTDSTPTAFLYENANNYTVVSGSSLIRVKIDVKVKNKKDSTSVLYEIRNSN